MKKVIKIFIGVISILIGLTFLFLSLGYLVRYISSHSTNDLIDFIFNSTITIMLGIIAFRCLKTFNEINDKEGFIVIIGIIEIVKATIVINSTLPTPEGVTFYPIRAIGAYLFMVLLQISIIGIRKFLINEFKDGELKIFGLH